MKKTVQIFLIIGFQLLSNNLFAQTSGCTDPLSNNYNPLATINDGSCTYNSSSIAPTFSNEINSVLSESSGIIIWNDALVTHNDNSDKNLYLLDSINGNTINTYSLTNAINIEWEDISQDDDYIYLGDFGNNSNGNRTNLRILKISKASILTHLPEIEYINFAYSNQTNFSATGNNNTDFDCEAFIVSNDSIYLFTKQWVSNKSSVYSLPKTAGTFTAKLKNTLNTSGLVTGATTLSDKKLTVLCGYTSLLQPFIYLLYDYPGEDFFSGNKRKISLSLPFHQIEGIATNNGLKYYLTNEYFTKVFLGTYPQKMHTLDLSSYLSSYLKNSTTQFVPNLETSKEATVFPNPSDGIITLKHSIPNAKYSISNFMGQIVYRGTLTNGDSSIEISQFPKGIYLIRFEQNNMTSLKLVKS